MFSTFDFDVIRRSLGYLFFDGMTFTLTLTALSAVGGLVFGTAGYLGADWLADFISDK